MNAKQKQVIDNIKSAIETKTTRDDVLRAAVELIDSYSPDFNWTGVYMKEGDVLKVGPYIGPETPHTVIELNRGICGAAASQKKSIIVDDVNSDPRFLACSLTTRSEIVVPIMNGDTCIGEIDIDSNRPACFTPDDREMLETAADIIVRRLKQI